MSRRRGGCRVLAIPALIAAVTLVALVTALGLSGDAATLAGLGLFVPLAAVLLGLLKGSGRTGHRDS